MEPRRDSDLGIVSSECNDMSMFYLYLWFILMNGYGFVFRCRARNATYISVFR